MLVLSRSSRLFSRYACYSGLRTVHRSAPVQALPPFLALAVKPVGRVMSVLIGRRARKWWQKLPPEKKEALKRRFIGYKSALIGVGAGFSFLCLYLYESHVQICPVTGRKRFIALLPDQMEKISQYEFNGLLEAHKDDLVPVGHPAYQRVTRVCNRILQANKDLEQIRDKNWTVTVVDQNVANALALPGGNIFVYTGMLELCANDDQLGVVISHEMSHSILQHASEKLSKVNFWAFLSVIPMALLWAILPNDGIAIIANWFYEKVVDLVLELPFSRHMEHEADEIGVRLAARACFDVREAPAFWAKMAYLEENKTRNLETGEKMPLPEFVSTHPSSDHRQQRLSKLLPEAKSLRQSCGCARLVGPDPGLSIAALRAWAQQVHQMQTRRLVSRSVVVQRD